MYKLALLFSVFFVLNATAKINNDSNSLCLDLDYIDLIKKEYELEKSLFEKVEDSNFENFDVNTIELVELEEDVELNFNPKDYLPEGFNALKGMHDLDWSTIDLIELEEDVELDFDTKDYLPVNFDPNKGMHSIKVIACLY